MGCDPHTKGYRVRVGNKVIVSRNVHFLVGKSGAVTNCPVILSIVGEETPVLEENEEEVDIDTSALPEATSNPFQPLMDLDNPDAKDVQQLHQARRTPLNV